MASKRQAASELNHLNWDQQDEEEEDPGVFKPVSDTELKTRVIKRAKRSLATDSGSEGASSSPFSAFSGFMKRSPQVTFSFRAQEKKIDSAAGSAKVPEKEAQNGCNQSSAVGRKSEPPKETLSAKRPCTSEEPKTDTKNVEYFRQLQSLNESVLKWMEMHLEKNPCCDFTPVFNDYKNHLQKLERVYPVPKKSEAKLGSFEASKGTSFKIPQSSSFKNPNFKSGTSPLERDSAEKGDEMPYGASFASSTTNTSTFSFGIKEWPTSMTSGSKSGPTTSFSSSKSAEEESEEPEQKSTSSFFKLDRNSDSPASTAPNSNSKPFSFGLSAISSSAGSSNENKEEAGPEEYVPPTNEFTTVSEEDALYTKRCKLFFKKGNEYVDKGVGTLYLKPLDGTTQLLIRADTNLGNILLNIRLSASLPIERTGKNNVLIVCVPYPPLNPKEKDDKKSIPLLIRVKTSEDADELFEKLNEHKS